MATHCYPTVARALLLPIPPPQGWRRSDEAAMREATHSSESGTVLVISAGSLAGVGEGPVAEQLGSDCVQMDRESAIAVLRTDPFAITAVVLSGDGRTPATTAVLESIKKAAPRIPIVFLDLTESADSELAIRRTGVHYYSHLPVNRAEISSVLASLRQEAGRREAGTKGRHGSQPGGQDPWQGGGPSCLSVSDV